MNANETTRHKKPNDTEITTVSRCMAFDNKKTNTP